MRAVLTLHQGNFFVTDEAHYIKTQTIKAELWSPVPMATKNLHTQSSEIIVEEGGESVKARESG